MKVLRQKPGFSLAELLISLAIISVISLVLTSFISKGFSLYRTNKQEIRLQEKNWVIMDDLIINLQNAKEITFAEGNEIIFITQNRESDQARARYTLTGSTLTKGVILPVIVGNDITYPSANETTKILSDQVKSAVIFSFYDGQGGLFSSPINAGSVRLVEVTLALDNDINTPGGLVENSTKINLRNLKNNL